MVNVPFRDPALGIVVVVNAGSVLRPRVPALSVQRGGVDYVPEHSQQVLVRHRGRVVGDLLVSMCRCVEVEVEGKGGKGI